MRPYPHLNSRLTFANPNMEKGLLDVLELDRLFNIRRHADMWIGELHTIGWEPIRSIGVALTSLCSSVCKRPEREFELHEFLRPEENGARVGVSVLRSADKPLSEDVARVRAAAVRHFLHLISCDGDLDNASLALDPDLTPEAENIVREAARAFLCIHGDKKVSVPITIAVARSDERHSLTKRLAPKPINDLPAGSIVVRAFVEGFDRIDRRCRLLSPDGGDEKGVLVKFKVERDLDRIREVVCNDRLYDIRIDDTLDARRRTDVIIGDIADLPPDENSEEILLKPTPTAPSTLNGSTRRGAKGKKR